MVLSRTKTDFKKKIDQIVADRKSGSTLLLKRIVLAFSDNSLNPDDRKWAFHRLHEIDESMAIIYHFLHHLEPYVDGIRFYDELNQYLIRYQNSDKNIWSNLRQLFDFQGKSLLTHSSSQQVQEVLSLIPSQAHVKIFQTLSIPGEEGLIQLEVFEKHGLACRLIDDHLIKDILSNIDACIMGVDQFDNHQWVNKIGTGAICEQADLHRVPVFVLGNTRKKVENLHYSNLLFESVPFDDHIHLVTEDSVEF